jgi:hypothetical protein
MDKHTYENWLRVKEALEKSGKTDSFFYQRACAIASSKRDPGFMPPAFGEDAS